MGALPSSTSRATEAVLTRAPVNCTLLRRLAALYDSTSPSSYLTMTGYRPASVHEMTVPTYARPSSNVLRTRSPTCAAACGAMSFSREKGEKGRGERERGAYATLTLYLQGCGGYLKITPNLKPLPHSRHWWRDTLTRPRHRCTAHSR